MTILFMKVVTERIGTSNVYSYLCVYSLTCICSELMQQGASLSASELLKIVTRGKTHRLSVEPMLEFFRPLDIWLEQQNRNEIVIGWNSNLEDVELFQGMLSAGSAAGSCGAWMAVLTSATLVVHILL